MLVFFLWWAFGGASFAIKSAVMAGTEETVVLGFPMDLAAEVGADARQSDECVRCIAFCLPRNDDGRSRRCGELNCVTKLQVVDGRYELPANVGRARWKQKRPGKSGESTVASGQPAGHGH